MNCLNLYKIITILLIFGLANTYASAQTVNNKHDYSAAQITENVLTGTLYTGRAQTVLVNNNLAEDGIAIFTGAEIKTAADEAAITIGGIGEVRLGANTTGKLTFDNASINLVLSAGSAQLSSLPGISGNLFTADGQKLSTDAASGRSTVKAIPEDPNSLPQTFDSSTRSSFFGMKVLETIGILGMAGLVITMGIMSATEGSRCNEQHGAAISRVTPCQQ